MRHGKQLLRCLPLVGMLFATSSVNAAGSPGVTFNKDVRYSQWAINSRSTSFNANTTQCGMATITNGSVSKESFGKSSLDYVPGLVAKSMIEAADYYQSFDWSKPWFISVKEYGDKYYNSVSNKGGSLDDLNAVKLYIGLYNNTNASSTDRKNYKNAISLAQTGLVAHNTKYSIQSGTLAEKAGNAVVGGWFHKANYNNQMWLDGAYMGSALLAQIVNFNGNGSNVFGSSEADWNMVAKQMNIVWNMCWNSTDKLLYHAFEANAGKAETTKSHAETWAGLSANEPYVFHSQSYWGRANAWYLMALVDVLEAMDKAGQSGTTNYTTLKQHLADLAAGIAARQDTKTGGWYQVMDKKADYSANNYNGQTVTAVSNYIETSATAIFSAAYFKAVRLGLLDSTTQYDYKTIAKNAFEGLVNNFVNTDNGDFHIWGSCRSAGLGGDDDKNSISGGKNFRYGSNAYYLLGYDVPMVKKDENITEGKVLGGFIMAATEYERAYQNQDSKQILFAKDLAPKYDFSTTAGSLDATAYGNGTITYQWYKGNAKVADATSATYTPTESGEYYCIASDGSNTIQTSTTTVTAATEGGDNNSGEPTVTTNVYDFKSNVGTTTSGNTAIEVTDDNIVFGANYKPREGKYITITPADANVGFKAGDVITITGRSTKGNALMTLNSTLDSETSEQYQFNALGMTETTYQYLLQADCPVLYLGRASGSTATITGLTVTRAAATNKTRLVATFPSNSITVVNTTETTTLPTLTVKDGETVLTDKDYTVEKKSDNEAVATIEGDIITIKGTTGTATVFAIITPKDKNTYEGCIATYQVTVKESTPLAISTMDVTMNTVDAEVKQPIIKVYGDNDKLLTFGTDYKLSYSVDNSNVKVDNAGKFSVDGSAYNWTAGTSKVTVTATPTENLGNTYTVGTLTFEYNVVKGKITPVFLEAFKDKTINVKNGSTKTFSVPLIYDGEDVSNYFVYTYTINGTAAASTNVEGNTLTFSKTTGEYRIDVTATPKKVKVGDDIDDYSEVYNDPVGISFKVNVSKDLIRPEVIVDPSTMTMYTGTFEEAADVTVMDEKDNIISDDLYKLQWISFTPGVVKVDENGNLEAVSEGTGLVHVVVTGNGLESMSTLLKVFVDDRALYRVKKTDNDNNDVTYGNQCVMWNQDKTMSVSLGGWMFPNNGTGVKKEITTEALSSDKKWDNTASQAKWKITGFDNVVLSDDSQNARQENGSNAMPESTDLYNVKFENKGTIVDKMFNVPCTGSYLAFNPATNGVVRVHIFQSGAFDHTKKDGYQYRPQRRVFVMDEAGNFVESSAEIENANGKPKGGVKDLSNYKWNLKSGNDAPAFDEVKTHFPKLPTSFAMTDAGFQNNVMESGLDKSLVHNNVPDGKSGANGWCVLADSPVTYSFRVKAGKTYYLYNFGSKIGFYGYSFEEDATKPKVDEVNYDEASTNTVTPTEDGHVAKVTINRKFTKGIWTTCVLPFSLNKHQVDAIFGTTYGITNDGTGTTNNNDNGTQILYFDRVEGNKAYFVRHAYNTIVAGKPFLIKPAKAVESINTAAVTDYPYVTIENTQPAEWCAGNGYAWVSSYSNDMTVKKGDCFISNKDGHFKNFVGDPGTLKGFRGYLKANLANGAKPQTLSVGMDSNVNEEGTSAIIGLTIDADGNIVTGVADGKVYNVNGQVVSEDSRNFGALPSGVYVINGKKYVK